MTECGSIVGCTVYSPATLHRKSPPVHAISLSSSLKTALNAVGNYADEGPRVPYALNSSNFNCLAAFSPSTTHHNSIRSLGSASTPFGSACLIFLCLKSAIATLHAQTNLAWTEKSSSSISPEWWWGPLVPLYITPVRWIPFQCPVLLCTYTAHLRNLLSSLGLYLLHG